MRPDIDEALADLVAANRILARHGIVDGYGHVSLRAPHKPDRYLLSRAIAPEAVTADDIVEFDLDSRPTRQTPDLYRERFIHGEIYRARPEVRAVVHNHAPSLIPFSVAATPLRPVYHMAAFVGQGIPIFEIRDTAGEATDLLIRSPALGRALATSLGDKPAALMRGHGATVVANSLPLVVARSIYLELNAKLQLQALTLAGPDGEVRYLSPDEAAAASATLGDYRRSWQLWRATALADLSAERTSRLQ